MSKCALWQVVHEGKMQEFWGEYGTNHCLPNMHTWAKEMRVPWHIATLRNDLSTIQTWIHTVQELPAGFPPDMY